MNNDYKNSNIIYKKVNYLLKSINPSLEIIIGFKTRKIYKFLKKVSKIINQFNLPKQELKQIAILIANNKFTNKTITNKISKIIFKFSKTYKTIIIYKEFLKICILFYEIFFDNKQIVRC